MRALRIALAALIAAAPSAAGAASDGGRPGAFLDYAASARSLGMGQAYTAIASDPSAIYWNPSAMSLQTQKSLAAQFSTLVDDASYGFVGYAQPWRERGGFGLGVVNLQSGSITRRDASGNRTGDYDAVSNAFLLSGSFRPREKVSFGSTAKIVRETVAGDSGVGVGLDVGTLVRATPKLQLGLMVRNLVAPSVKLDRESEDYPRAVVAGLGITPSKALTLGVDLEQHEDLGFRPRLGADYVVGNLVALRAGVNDDELTAGLGVGIGEWSFDYAMGYARASSEISDLGSFHRFGVQFNFGAARAGALAVAPATTIVIDKPEAPAPKPAPAKPKPAKAKKAAKPAKAAKKAKAAPPPNQPALDNLRVLGERMDNWDGLPTPEIQKLVDAVSRDARKGRYLETADINAAHGYVAYFTGDYARSIRHLEAALKAEPDSKPLAARLKRVQDLDVRPAVRKHETPEIRAIRERFEQGNYSGAILLAQRAVESSPGNEEAASYLRKSLDRLVQPYQKRAKELLDRNRFLEAYVMFQKTLDYDPENAEAKVYSDRVSRIIEKKNDLEYLAKTTPRKGDVDKGLDHYEKGLRLYGHGETKRAHAAWNDALPLLRSHPVLYDAVRSTLVELGR